MDVDADLDHFKALCSQKTLQKEPQGFFFGLVDKVSPVVNIRALAALETDLDRMKYCCGTFWDLIGAEMVFKTKSAEDATEKRLEGNEAFLQSDFKKALKFYSQAVVRAPPGPDLAMVLSNRSTLFQKLGEVQLSLDDAELAVSNDYPMDKRHKLYERMVSNYIHLRRFPDAKRILRLAKHLGEKNGESDPKFWAKLAKAQTTITDLEEPKSPNPPTPTTPKPSPEVVKNSSAKFPTASAAFNVDVTCSNQGRHAVATQDIPPCETLLREPAFASILMPDRFGTHCITCLRRLKAAIPCDSCANVAYCSRSCKQAGDVTFHRFECKILTLLIGSGMSELSHLALRIVTQTSLEDLKQAALNLKPDETQLHMTSEGQYMTSNYANIYNLCALADQRTSEDLFHRTVMAVFLMKCLRLVGFFDINLFKQRYPTQDELFIGSLLLRNLQVLQFNAYEVTEMLCKSKANLRDHRTINVGLAVYATASMMNHSCAPNVTRTFDGTTILVQSLQKIPSGTAITDNYGPIFTKHRSGDRRRNLEGRYWFQCCCRACSENWPLLQALPDEVSHGPSGFKSPLVTRLQGLIQTYFLKGIDALNRGNPLVATEYLKKFLLEFHALEDKNGVETFADCFKLCKHVFLAQDALRLMYSSKGNVFFVDEGPK